jgi:hypothetical protein
MEFIELYWYFFYFLINLQITSYFIGYFVSHNHKIPDKKNFHDKSFLVLYGRLIENSKSVQELKDRDRYLLSVAR